MTRRLYELLCHYQDFLWKYEIVRQMDWIYVFITWSGLCTCRWNNLGILFQEQFDGDICIGLLEFDKAVLHCVTGYSLSPVLAKHYGHADYTWAQHADATQNYRLPRASSVSSPAVNQQADTDQSQVMNSIDLSSPKSKTPKARMRVNLARKCKVTRHDDDATPQKTPMSSPNSPPNPLGPVNVECDNLSPFNGRNLTNVVASVAATSPVNNTNNSQNKDDMRLKLGALYRSLQQRH